MDPEDTGTIPDYDIEKPEPDEEFLLAKEETAYQVYKSVWNDFYNWEQGYCVQTLQDLEQPAVHPEPLPVDNSSDSDSDSFDSLTEYTEWFTFEGLDEQGSVYYEDALPLRLKLQEEDISPYLSYSTCTPSSTNAQYPRIFMDKAPFTPFSDDPGFKKHKYLSSFNSFGWQTEFWDPDREIVFLETARRLYHGHGFTYLDIDNLQIHYVPLRIDGSAGMIWEVSQRDRLLWPGSQMSALPDLAQQGGQSNSNLHESVTQGIVAFCGNLNCLRSACLAHGESHPTITKKPTVTSKDLRSTHDTPCDRNCFKTYVATDAECELSTFAGSWHEKDLSLFSSVIKFAPDSRPCDLAVICRKPCIETYIQRCKHVSDDEIEAGKEEDLVAEPLNMIFGEDDLFLRPDVALEDRVKQCYHPGTCNQYSNCSCYNNRQRCQRTCRCSKTCNLRFKGCKCDGPRPCAEADCPCQKAGRECEPEVCITCDARRSKGSRASTCRNTMLQRGGFERIWIHSSKFGLGAFAMNKIDSGKCVGDYVGEFVSEDIDLSMIRKFLDRNYAFGLTRGLSLDSQSLGNETRYLNHSESANCYAKLVMVNGDIRIGIYTAAIIKKRGELFLDYGENYWAKRESDDEDLD